MASQIPSGKDIALGRWIGYTMPNTAAASAGGFSLDTLRHALRFYAACHRYEPTEEAPRRRRCEILQPTVHRRQEEQAPTPAHAVRSALRFFAKRCTESARSNGTIRMLRRVLVTTPSVPAYETAAVAGMAFPSPFMDVRAALRQYRVLWLGA